MIQQNNYPIFVRVIVRHNNYYLLIKEVKSNQYNMWNFPGGKVEIGEKSEAAAIRELKEETNLMVSDIKLFYTNIYTFPNMGTWKGVYYLADITDTTTIHINEPNKCYGYCWLPLEEIKTLQPLGIISDVLELLQ